MGGTEDVTREISVVCRIRPLNQKEIREGSAVVTRVGAGGKSLDLVGSEKMHFDYDAVIDCEGSQEDVYIASAKPVVDDFLEGFNGTLFCYGQTGSGKTYTMEGDVSDDDKRGLLPRMVCAVFDYMENSGEHMQFMINVQFLEIYNEKIRDLLAPDKDNLKIRELKSGDLYVEGASQHYITSELEVAQALEAGAASRATAETYMNQASSRLH
jgi:kinesin family protein 5